MPLPDCETLAEEGGLCCRDLFDAMRLVESQAEPNEGIGAAPGPNPRIPSYGPYQIQRTYQIDALDERRGGCGPYMPARGGYGVPGGPRATEFWTGEVVQIPRPIPITTSFGWPMPNSPTSTFDPTFVRWDKDLSEHVMCCYFNRYLPTESKALKCCTDKNEPTGGPVSLSIANCTPSNLQDLEKIARLHNGGPRMRFPSNWGATAGTTGLLAKNSKIYWDKVCRQFGAKDTKHPNALEICTCT